MMSKPIEVGSMKKLKGSTSEWEVHIQGNPIEIARALYDLKQSENLKYLEMKEAVKMSIGTISKYLSLLKLESFFQDQLENNNMAFNTGYILVKLPDDKKDELKAWSIADDPLKPRRITLRQVEEIKRSLNVKRLYGVFTDMGSIMDSLDVKPEGETPDAIISDAEKLNAIKDFRRLLIAQGLDGKISTRTVSKVLESILNGEFDEDGNLGVEF